MTAASLWGKLEVRPVSVKLNLKIQSWDWVRQSCSLWRQPHAERRSINTDSRNVWTQILINNLWINNTDFTALKKLHFIHGHFYKIFFLEQSTKKTKEKNWINSNSSIKQSLLWRLWHFLIVAANAFFFSWKSDKICKGKLGTAPLIASVVLDLESRSAQQDNGFTEGSEWGRRSEWFLQLSSCWCCFSTSGSHLNHKYRNLQSDPS